MSTTITRDDWRRLAQLRASFLGAEDRRAGTQIAPYWTGERDLELYDATFGQRIAWKWRAVLHELDLRGRMPTGELIVDWGCGSGTAARTYFAHVKAPAGTRAVVFDHWREASEFAREQLMAEQPQLDVSTERPREGCDPDVLLVSHVLDELGTSERRELLDVARRSRAVLWVEAGSRAVSRELSKLRDELLGDFDVVAPCTHRAACGMLAAGNEENWCHHFARPPGEAFTTAHWRAFAEELGVDLRSVPYSFLALVRRSDTSAQSNANARLLGRPRMLKGRALIDVCDESGVRELQLLQRTDKALFKHLDDCAGEPLLYRIEVDDKRITSIEPRVE
jgi:SAM-dependent methyltransferase